MQPRNHYSRSSTVLVKQDATHCVVLVGRRDWTVRLAVVNAEVYVKTWQLNACCLMLRVTRKKNHKQSVFLIDDLECDLHRMTLTFNDENDVSNWFLTPHNPYIEVLYIFHWWVAQNWDFFHGIRRPSWIFNFKFDLNMWLWPPINKMMSEMDSPYPKTHKMMYYTYFNSDLPKMRFSKWPFSLVGHGVFWN